MKSLKFSHIALMALVATTMLTAGCGGGGPSILATSRSAESNLIATPTPAPQETIPAVASENASSTASPIDAEDDQAPAETRSKLNTYYKNTHVPSGFIFFAGTTLTFDGELWSDPKGPDKPVSNARIYLVSYINGLKQPEVFVKTNSRGYCMFNYTVPGKKKDRITIQLQFRGSSTLNPKSSVNYNYTVR